MHEAEVAGAAVVVVGAEAEVARAVVVVARAVVVAARDHRWGMLAEAAAGHRWAKRAADSGLHTRRPLGRTHNGPRWGTLRDPMWPLARPAAAAASVRQAAGQTPALLIDRGRPE